MKMKSVSFLQPVNFLQEIYKITINGTKYISADQFISGKQMRPIDEMLEKSSLWLKVNLNQSVEIGDNDTLDLSRPGLEAFFSLHHN
jgi:hypothetical protein